MPHNKDPVQKKASHKQKNTDTQDKVLKIYTYVATEVKEILAQIENKSNKLIIVRSNLFYMHSTVT